MPAEFSKPADFAGANVLVCGTGMAGRTATQALLELGARVQVCADGAQQPELPDGARYLGALTELPPDVQVVISSPGLSPNHPLLRQAAAETIPVFGELEFAWRIRGDRPARWLLVTGTNGKTTAVRMLEAMLRAGGLRALAVGNVGVSIIEAVRSQPGYDVLAVEASSFQLHFSSSLMPLAGALLNLAEDHLDWHGSMASYAEQKTKVWTGDCAIGNADDPMVSELLATAPARRKVTFTLTEPTAGQFGVRAGQLVDPAGAAILAVSEVRPAGAHNVANALAAAALASAAGLGGEAIALGLRDFVPDPHRNQLVATVDGVGYVDDSKATNPHAAAASLAGYPSVVWIAGGQLKGANVEPLVAEYAGRLAGAVLLGTDREEIRLALARHAPDLPVIVLSRTDHGAMQDAVAAAASLAHAGDVVLLAPAAASKDMFASYGARGTAFVAAVGELPGARG
ncbi:MAG: UDP-N-acetylmuramoyl-L-alanine--D-glutamate ligase [Actinomycetota bacterium]|nr:UDP-N-acetylmuramoyl-L-alanine--D-glutamate ligase [Actinomycetota bacterium]MDQ2958264.1 UDP-N-acetylmuramoyl-L-alanine--D-glutamate ligase [Actinomycetota bacterium]